MSPSLPQVSKNRSEKSGLEVSWAGRSVYFFRDFLDLIFAPKSVLKMALFGQNGPQNGPPRGRERPPPGFFCPNVPPIPPPGAGRRFGAGPVTIPESHFFTRVASGGLLLVKVGPEPGGGDALGLTRKSARIEFFLWSLLLNKSARAKPLAAIWAR